MFCIHIPGFNGEISCVAVWFWLFYRRQFWPHLSLTPSSLQRHRFLQSQGCRRRRALLLPRSIPKRFARMCDFCRSICWKAADPAHAEIELAAEYIATQFALAGLQPAGDNGTYFQRVPLYAVHTVEDKTKFSFVPAKRSSRSTWPTATEIVSKDQTGQATADIDAPIVFVGYGIDAPEYNWDDYAGSRREGQNRAGDRERAALGR